MNGFIDARLYGGTLLGPNLEGAIRGEGVGIAAILGHGMAP